MIPPEGRAKGAPRAAERRTPDAPWHYGGARRFGFRPEERPAYAGWGTAASRRKVKRLAVRGVDDDVVALAEAAGEHLDRQRVLDHPLDRALERPRAEHRVVAALGQASCAPRPSARSAIFRSASRFCRSRSWMSTMRLQVLAAERAEDDDLVDAVQELGPERACAARPSARPCPRRVSRRAISWMRSEPTFDVMMTTVLRKSTVRPLPSVRRPSSSTCSSTLNTSGCAFSISSNRTTAYGRRRTASVSWPPSS